MYVEYVVDDDDEPGGALRKKSSSSSKLFSKNSFNARDNYQHNQQQQHQQQQQQQQQHQQRSLASGVSARYHRFAVPRLVSLAPNASCSIPFVAQAAVPCSLRTVFNLTTIEPAQSSASSASASATFELAFKVDKDACGNALPPSDDVTLWRAGHKNEAPRLCALQPRDALDCIATPGWLVVPLATFNAAMCHV